MNNKEVFNKLIDFCGFEIFQPAIYHNFENVNRIYLDDIFDIDEIQQSMRFFKIIPFVHKKIEGFFNKKDDFFVCLCFYQGNEDKMKGIFKGLNDMSFYDIEIPNNVFKKTIYIDDEEGYFHFFFFKESKSNLIKYLSAILSTISTYDTPIFYADVYFVSLDLSKLVHLYDDRGMDLLSIKP